MDPPTATDATGLTNTQTFSILMRVRINPNGAVLTPDWMQDEDRLHEWPADGE